MTKFGLLGTSALRSAAIIGLFTASSAFAQQASDQDAAANKQVPPQTETAQAATDAGSSEQIVVTGSRIARPNLESTIPITSVTGAQLEQTGRVSVGDVLNDLPQLQSTFSQANSTRFLGTAGLNLLDLYGLGTQRTLVLVNGRRHVGSDILNNAVSPDVNTFPTDLIDRVDVVTGGNSAVYGSDAIAGVVNFVLKDHFDGVQVHGQGAVSQYGDAGAYYASVLAGHNFSGGRGNIAVDLEYARQNSLYASDRDYLQHNNGFVVVDTDPSGSDGNPDRIFVKDIRSVTISNGGNILFNGRSAANGAVAGRCGRDNAGNAFDCAYTFLPDGSLVPQTGTRIGISPNGSVLGGNGSTFREGQLVQLLPQLDRYSANLIGHFDISDAFVPFVEASYVRTDSVGQGGSGPAFFQGGTIDGFYEQPRLDNPFLSDQARAVITQQLIASGVAPASITGATRFALRRNLLDLGVRSEEAKRETYRIVGGLRGTFNDDWKYEISGNYGEFDEKTKVLGNLNVQRFLLAMDAQRNPAGQIVCGSQLDGGAGYTDDIGGDIGGNPAVLAADIAACQPLNPFGLGNISQAAKNYVLTDTVSTGKITQLVFSGSLTGSTSKFLNLPGGPIGFAIGAEYRKETAFFEEDPLVEAGYTFYNAINKFDPPSFEVKELYGELRVPILNDRPFFDDLELSGSGRVADYKGSTGTVYAYSGGADYSPIHDIHFRANYSRAVRAPNLTELYSPQSQNFAPGFVDPCSLDNIGTGSDTRIANCRAAGIPANYNFNFSGQGSLAIVTGGNPDLKAETSDSYTYGVVLQPRWVPGLSASVDYYNIRVNKVITAPTAQQIANSCYDLATLDNPFCPLFQRDDAAGSVTGTPFRIINGTLQQTLFNYAKLKARGLNVEVAYSHRVGDDVTLGGKFTWTHQFENSQFIDPTDPGRADTFLTEVGSPRDDFLFNADLSTSQFFVNYQLHHLSHQIVTGFQYEDLYSFQGRPAQNADFADIEYYPSVTYHNIRVGVKVMEASNFYIGVDNLTNLHPPLSSTAIGGGTAIFEQVGRRFYAGFNVKY